VDETAFRSFYDRTVLALRSYLRMLCRNTAVADDLLQESYFRFLRAGILGLNELQMKAYLYRAATSASRDHWRAEKRDRRLQQVTTKENETAWDPNLSHDMNQLFQKLNPNEQTLLWLAYVEGFQHREIAEALNLKEKSVRVMLFRARKQLAGMVTQEGLGPKEKA
jgi:RNA polymerase sigma-70 factor (ECF subfamily)